MPCRLRKKTCEVATHTELKKMIERKLWLVDEAGRRADINIEIGSPQWETPDVLAVCSVYIRGMMSKPLNVFGGDLLGAVECSLSFVNQELRNIPAGHSIQWPGGEPYFEQLRKR